MAISTASLAFGYPGFDTLFSDVSFQVRTGEHAALIGDNAVGKSTLLRVAAGLLDPENGSVRIDGVAGYMPQSIGQADDDVSVIEFMAGLSGTRAEAAWRALVAAETANEGGPSAETGMTLAAALEVWADVQGYELEASWDAAILSVLGVPPESARNRRLVTLSGGERKRLALELLFASDADVLLLDEPDNFLDIPAKRWLEGTIRASSKTLLVISHDRELLSNAITKLVTIEGSGAWVHGGSFSGYHEVRDARNERLGDLLDRWKDEERRLYRYMKTLKQRAAISEAMAARADAAESRWKRFVDAGPPPPPPPQRSVSMRLQGADSGRKVVICDDLALAGLTLPFSLDVRFGDRVAVLGANGTGKSHLIRLLGGETIDHEGAWRLGARVKAGLFVQTNRRPDLENTTAAESLEPLLGNTESIMRVLARYGLHGAARQDYSTLSGGQQARLQVLSLELGGANLLLLDEPTDNLDLVSAEALQDALEDFTGTVLAVTHDRWFMRTFDRFIIITEEGSVEEAMDLETALGIVSADPSFQARPGSLRRL